MPRKKNLFGWILNKNKEQCDWINDQLIKNGYPIMQPGVIYPREQLIAILNSRIPERLIMKLRPAWNKKKSLARKTEVQLSCYIGKRFKSKLNTIKKQNNTKDQGATIELIISEREKDKKEIEELRIKSTPHAIKGSNLLECQRLRTEINKQKKRNENLSKRLHRHTSALNKLKEEYEKLSEELSGYRATHQDKPVKPEQMTRKEQIEFIKLMIEQHRILAYIENPETQEKEFDQ